MVDPVLPCVRCVAIGSAMFHALIIIDGSKPAKRCLYDILANKPLCVWYGNFSVPGRHEDEICDPSAGMMSLRTVTPRCMYMRKSIQNLKTFMVGE